MSARNRSYVDMASQKLRPCFGYPLHKISKWISMVNMVLSLAHFILILGVQVLFVMVFGEVKEHIFKLDPESTGYSILVTGSEILVVCVLLAFMAICIASIYLNYLLYEGVEQKNSGKVLLWLVIATAHLLLATIGSISLSVLFSTSVIMVVYETLLFIYLSYSLWVVYEYNREIQPTVNNLSNYDYDVLNRV